MYRYCVDFESPSADWIGYQANSELMPDGSFSCGRAWVVVESADFAGLNPSLNGGGGTQFTSEEIAKLKQQAALGVPSGALGAEDGALLAWGVVLAWTAGWAARQVIRAFRGTSSDESV